MSRHTFLKSPSMRVEPRSPGSTFLSGGHFQTSHEMTATSGLLARAKHKYLQNIEDTTHNLPTSPQHLSTRQECPEICSTSGSTLSRTQSSAFRKKGFGYSERASSSRTKSYSNMFLSKRAEITLDPDKQMVGESLASRQNWKKKKELKQYRQEAAKLLAIRIYKLFAKHFDSVKLFAHQSMLEGYRGQKHLSERLRDAKQKGKTIRTHGQHAVLESHHFDPIKSGRKLLREQSLQELRKRMRLGLPLRSIEPEHVGSPVSYSRQMSGRRFKQEILSDRSHYFTSKENNPNSQNSSARFMQTFDNSGTASKLGKSSRRQNKIEEGIIRRSLNKYSDLHVNRKPNNDILKSPEPECQRPQRGTLKSASRTSSSSGKYLKLKEKDLLDQASIRPPLDELGAVPIEEIPLNELETPSYQATLTSESCLLSGKKAAITAGFLRTVEMMLVRMKKRRAAEGMQAFKENAVLRISIERALLIFKTARQRFLKRMLITLFRSKASTRFMMGLHQNTGTFGQCSLNLSPTSSEALADIAMAARQSLSQVIESKLWGDNEQQQKTQKVSMFQTNDTSRHSIEDFKQITGGQKVYRRAHHTSHIISAARGAQNQPKAAMLIVNILKKCLLMRARGFIKKLRAMSQSDHFKELRAITLQQSIVMVLKRQEKLYFGRWKIQTKFMGLMKQRRAAFVNKLLGLNKKRGSDLVKLQALWAWQRKALYLRKIASSLLELEKVNKVGSKRALFKKWTTEVKKTKVMGRCIKHKEATLKTKFLAKYKTETIRSLISRTKKGSMQNKKRATLRILKLYLKLSSFNKALQRWKVVCLKQMKLDQRKALQHTLKYELALNALRRFGQRKNLSLKKEALLVIRNHKLGNIKDLKRRGRQMAEVLKNIHHSRALRLREAFVGLIMFSERREKGGRMKLELRRNTLDIRTEHENIAPINKRVMQSLSPQAGVQTKEAYLAQFQKKRSGGGFTVPFGENSGVMNRAKKSSKAFNRYA